jgi:hypothetical protein
MSIPIMPVCRLFLSKKDLFASGTNYCKDSIFPFVKFKVKFSTNFNSRFVVMDNVRSAISKFFSHSESVSV